MSQLDPFSFSLSLSLSLSLCLAGYKIIVSQFICSHTAFTYTKRNISDFSQTRKKQKKKLERRINRGGDRKQQENE